MSATTWLIIAIVGFSLSGVALVAAVFMFIKMNILAVIGDLSGKTVAREIKAMRDANASSGDKMHKSSRVNIDRGKLTEKVEDGVLSDPSYMAKAHASKRLDRTESGSSAKLGVSQKLRRERGNTTESLSSNVGEVDIEARVNEGKAKARVTDILDEKNRTDVLTSERQTEVLSETRQTEVLSEPRQTEVLSEIEDDLNSTEVRNGTTVLSETSEHEETHTRNVTFRVTKSKVIIHSDEVIE